MSSDDVWLEGIVVYGMRVTDLPVPGVPSMPYVCDLCGASIWLSEMTLTKVSEVMMTPQHLGAEIMYLCHAHNEDGSLPTADEEAYGCPACDGDVSFPTQEEVMAHWRENHADIGTL